MTDDKIVAAAVEMIKANPHIARSRVARNIGTTVDRLERLGREGRVKLPPKMSSSMSGRIGALTNSKGWRGTHKGLFRLKGSPTKKERA